MKKGYKVPELSTRLQQAAVVKAIGTRMREARELCNMSQSVAADRFGYSNPSKLSKVEGATDTNSVPLWLIISAAKLYDVSIDYIFGSSDEWETGSRMHQERETSAWMLDAWEKGRRRDMETLRVLHNKVEAMESSIGVMLAASEEIGLSLTKFMELNPGFDDMRAGSRLVSSIERATDAAISAKLKMKKFRVECTVAASSTTTQLSLTL